MPLYKITMWANREVELEVEAKNPDEARDKYVSQVTLRDGEEWDDTTMSCEPSDNQYTDQQELKDREGDHEL